MSKDLIVIIQEPFTHVVFARNLETATVTMFNRVYRDLPVKKRWLGESDYLYSIIVPIAPLPAKRWLLAISRDVIYGYKHPERQPFPELQDSEPMDVKPKRKKDSQQMELFSEGEA